MHSTVVCSKKMRTKTIDQFDPFADRLCRDIRNNLSKAMMTSLRHLDLTPAEDVADQYLTPELHHIYRQYINDRMASYRRALQTISKNHIEETLRKALVLWDEELFFEVHEILEQAWLKSSGKTKLMLQAMIRAAGMYVQLDHGNTKGAASMAAKAVVVLEANRSMVQGIFDIDLLLAGLKDVSPKPSKLTEGYRDLQSKYAIVE